MISYWLCFLSFLTQYLYPIPNIYILLNFVLRIVNLSYCGLSVMYLVIQGFIKFDVVIMFQKRKILCIALVFKKYILNMFSPLCGNFNYLLLRFRLGFSQFHTQLGIDSIRYFFFITRFLSDFFWVDPIDIFVG